MRTGYNKAIICEKGRQYPLSRNRFTIAQDDADCNREHAKNTNASARSELGGGLWQSTKSHISARRAKRRRKA